MHLMLSFNFLLNIFNDKSFVGIIFYDDKSFSGNDKIAFRRDFNLLFLILVKYYLLPASIYGIRFSLLFNFGISTNREMG